MKCTECNGIITIEGAGETVCSRCGLVITERGIDYSHYGVRAFTLNEWRKRINSGPHDTKLSQMHQMSTLNKEDIKDPDLLRAYEWGSQRSWHQRNLKKAYTEMQRISFILAVPDYVRDNAFNIYKRAKEKGLLKGRAIIGFVAASLFYACRKDKISRSLRDIMQESSMNNKSMKKISMHYKILIKELNLKVPPPDPKALISRFIADLGLNAKVEKLTLKILNKLSSKYTSGLKPEGIVAGAIYSACMIADIKITQEEITKATNVSEVTIRKRRKEILARIQLTDLNSNISLIDVEKKTYGRVKEYAS
jgi:transcription initiation factor TFIIB